MELVGIKQFFPHTLKSTQIGLRHFSFRTQFIRFLFGKTRQIHTGTYNHNPVNYGIDEDGILSLRCHWHKM